MASNINIQKKCEWCGKLFIAHKTSTRCCSHRCANLAYKEKTRQKRVSEFQTMVNHQIEKEDCIDKDFFTQAKLQSISASAGLPFTGIWKLT